VELERDFVTWLDRRDAQALARVFDATGGKLLLLATHVGGAGQQAQDLVQATFLAAMAHGASWDRARPLWPWLAAILHNEARMQARRGRRRREVALDDVSEGDAVVAGAQGPQELAASEEMLAVVLRALDALPLPYRQVLRLRLVHGLRPIDIARSLEVPVGTVRAQLHRGLEQLRGSLPVGVAGVVAALLAGDEALLAQVRENVLQHALGGEVVTAGAIGAARVAVAGGFWSLHGKTVVMALAACAVLVCLGAALGMPAWPWTSPVDAAPAVPVRTDQPIAAANPQTPTPEPDRQAAVVADEPAWPLVVTVQTHAGERIPAAEVTVWATLQGGVYWNRDSSEFGREDVAAGTTGADGVFRASLDGWRERSPLANRTTYLWIEAKWPHDQPQHRIGLLPRTREAQPVTATIELRRRRVVITGRAVDGSGAPVARAQVGTTRGRSNGVGDDSRTRADGTFFIGCDEDAESWPDRLVIASAEHGAATVAVPPWTATPQPIDLGTIVLASGACVHGRVELGDGSTVAGVQLKVERIDPSLGDDVTAIHRWLMNADRRHERLALREGGPVWSSGQTNTAADGTFRFANLDPDGVYLLSMWGFGALPDRVVRPDTDAVDVRVDKQLLTIEVFDEQAAPLPGAQVRLAGYDPSNKSSSYQQWPGFPETGLVCSNWLPGAAPDGRRIFLVPFGFIVRITIADDCVQPVAVRHEALPGMHRATCRVDVRTEGRFGKLHICAVDENGKPIDFGPYLKALDRQLHVNDRRTIKPPEGWTWDLPAGRWHVETVLGKEVCYLQDDGGYARGFQEHVVTVEDGKTTELKLVAPPAGLVAFDVTSGGKQITSWHKLRVEAAGRPLDVLARDPNDMRLGFRDSSQMTRFVGKQAFSPGKHTFLLQADGYQPATCHVDVVADALTHVRVEMQLLPK
jgi:RNA polymerase sigma factor (sigma-70 family)